MPTPLRTVLCLFLSGLGSGMAQTPTITRLELDPSPLLEQGPPLSFFRLFGTFSSPAAGNPAQLHTRFRTTYREVAPREGSGSGTSFRGPTTEFQTIGTSISFPGGECNCPKPKPADLYPTPVSVEAYVALQTGPNTEVRSTPITVPFKLGPRITSISPNRYELASTPRQYKVRIQVSDGTITRDRLDYIRLLRNDDAAVFAGTYTLLGGKCPEAGLETFLMEGATLCDATVVDPRTLDVTVLTNGAKSREKYLGRRAALVHWIEPYPGLSPGASRYAVALDAIEFVEGASGPVLSSGGVVDAAQYQKAVSPCQLAAAFGSNLAGATAVASRLPLPRNLSGVRILVNGVEAALLFASSGQVNFQVPCEAATTGNLSVVVEYNGRASAPQTVEAAPATPGVFTNPDTGDPIVIRLPRPGEIQPVENKAFLINQDNPARPGDWLTMFVTGVGRGDPPVRTGEAVQGISRSTLPTMVKIGDEEMPVQFTGYTPGFVGLGQINFRLPAEFGQKLSGDRAAAVPVSLSLVVQLPLVVQIGSRQSRPVQFAVDLTEQP